jgi:hypothetical protein
VVPLVVMTLVVAASVVRMGVILLVDGAGVVVLSVVVSVVVAASVVRM